MNDVSADCDQIFRAEPEFVSVYIDSECCLNSYDQIFHEPEFVSVYIDSE